MLQSTSAVKVMCIMLLLLGISSSRKLATATQAFEAAATSGLNFTTKCGNCCWLHPSQPLHVLENAASAAVHHRHISERCTTPNTDAPWVQHHCSWN
jgi:hypothetical protein